MPEGGKPEVVDLTAREWALEAQGQAREASQRVDSYTKVSEERWANQRREWEEARRALERISGEQKTGFYAISTKMDQQHAEIKEKVKEIEVKFEIDKDEKSKAIALVDKTYNSRFWQLSVGMIAVLLTLCGVLAAHQFLH